MGKAMESIAPLFGERRERAARQLIDEAASMERNLALLQEALYEKQKPTKPDTRGVVKK